jgi:hypothetical protein
MISPVRIYYQRAVIGTEAPLHYQQNKTLLMWYLKPILENSTTQTSLRRT